MGSGSAWGRNGFRGIYLQPPSSYREASKKMELGSSALWLEMREDGQKAKQEMSQK